VARRVKFEIDGVAAVAELCEALSPNATEAFWQSLPYETKVGPVRWSGNTTWCMIRTPHTAAFQVNENPVCSIYPGYVVMRAGGEVLISFGAAEVRPAEGTVYATRVAKLVEGRREFLDLVSRVQAEGQKAIKITRA
jgi:hypothetical protein